MEGVLQDFSAKVLDVCWVRGCRDFGVKRVREEIKFTSGEASVSYHVMEIILATKEFDRFSLAVETAEKLLSEVHGD